MLAMVTRHRHELVQDPVSFHPVAEGILASDGHLISPIIAAVLCMKPRPLLAPRKLVKLQALKNVSLDFVAMRQFVMRFRGIMRSGDMDKLNVWIDDVRDSGI